MPVFQYYASHRISSPRFLRDCFLRDYFPLSDYPRLFSSRLFPPQRLPFDCFPPPTIFRLLFSTLLSLHLFVFCSFSGDDFECSCALIFTLFNADILNMGFMQCHCYLIATKQPVDNNRLCLSCRFAFKKHFLFRRSF